ncbi:MAG: hypothetical protein EXR62_16630 [Chloroflexi bacterium]|nr:hypothetical protein [Chloroflexota bacterium]
MEILENRDQWYETYKHGWLAHFQVSGETNFKLYTRPKNETSPAGPGIDLRQSRLIYISSAGGYLPASQEPFDAPSPLGDYSIRLIPTDTPLDRLAFAHTHYNHEAVNLDPQVQVPLRHLEELRAESVIGSLTPAMINFMGYQPDATRVIDEMIPHILEAVRAQGAQGALLAPA